jgi:hypothetical protein
VKLFHLGAEVVQVWLEKSSIFAAAVTHGLDTRGTFFKKIIKK